MSAPGWTIADVLVTAGLPRDTAVAIRPQGARHRVTYIPDGNGGCWWALLPKTVDLVLACGWVTGRVSAARMEALIAIAKLASSAVAQGRVL